MAGFWTIRQFGNVVHRFRDRECRDVVWDEVLFSLAILIERGPVLSGPQVAKKLKGGDGIWELIAKYDNLQPRLLFYLATGSTIVFVHAIMKKGKEDYVPAIRLAQQRRKAIERGNAAVTVVTTARVH